VSGGWGVGLPTGGAGVAVAAVAAVAAQVTSGGGKARGIALGAAGTLFVIRAMGDVQGAGDVQRAGLSWLSPFGWARLSRAWTGDRWWVLLLFVAWAVVFAGIAYGLSARRDLAAGLLPDRPGPAAGAPGLRGRVALAWRSQRGALIAWTCGCGLVGLLLGGAAKGAAGQLSGMFAGADALFTFSLLVLSQAVSAYAVSAALRPRSEEEAGLAELLLATAPDRTRWASAHLLFAVAGPVVMLTAAGACMGLAYGLSTGDVGGQVVSLTGSALEWLPAVWVMAGLAMALLGLLPRAVAAAWALLAGFLLIELAFEFGQVSDVVLGLSPFSHVPRTLLGAPFSVTPLVSLALVAALLAAAGLAGIRRRDIG
ncbi:hypothetical protein, partial [Nonomuraea rhizosphaerae]|uniref:hypothetical protein n=1 Tax=Nonomuraea rhizosphaerae TaxID=2665663 RepID=UPI001C5D17EB